MISLSLLALLKKMQIPKSDNSNFLIRNFYSFSLILISPFGYQPSLFLRSMASFISDSYETGDTITISIIYFPGCISNRIKRFSSCTIFSGNQFSKLQSNRFIRVFQPECKFVILIRYDNKIKRH